MKCFDTGYKRRINNLTPDEVYNYIQYHRQATEMSEEWKQFCFEQNITVPLYMLIDDGLSNSACRAMLSSKEDTDVYTQKYSMQSKSNTVESMMENANQPVRGLVLDADGIFDPEKDASRGSGQALTGMAFDLPPDITADESLQILKNIEHCAVGLVEHMALSQVVLEFYFPWLQFSVFSKPTKLRMKIYSDVETVDELEPWIKEMILQANQCDMQLYNHMLEIFESQMYIVFNNAFQE